MALDEIFLILQSLRYPFVTSLISESQDDGSRSFEMGGSHRGPRLHNIKDDLAYADINKYIQKGQTNLIIVSPVFKIIFFTIFFITMFSGITSIVIAFLLKVDSQNQQTIFESMNTVWKLGVGAILGLIGGKAT